MPWADVALDLGQAAAALLAATAEDGAAVGGLHAGAETDLTGALDLGGLVQLLHGVVPLWMAALLRAEGNMIPEIPVGV